MKRGNNRERREKEKAERRERKRIAMQTPGAMSNYARKRIYLNRHGGFGFEYPGKPWKGGVS